MGASGSGKTTLLNVLTSRNIDALEISGDVKANGLPYGRGMASLSAYVQQEDMFVGVLTVREQLWFQAMLRMNPLLTTFQREKRVDEVIEELGLKKCTYTRIGVPGRVKSISGGERKRLAFACEVLTDPPLMFCDEPTSGLDSFMAENVVQTLKTMADKGKTILCTIHQPSSQVFALFDNLLLLAEGEVAYLGPTSNLNPYFANLGHVCPPMFNPADFYIGLLAKSHRINISQQATNASNLQNICDKYSSSPERQAVTSEINSICSKVNGVVVLSPKALETSNTSAYRADFIRQFRYVFWRSWMTNMRDRSLFLTRFLVNILLALLTGLLFFQQPMNQAGVQGINSAIYLISMYATFFSAYGVMNVFPEELPQLKREHQNGMYRVSVYYLCKTTADTPIFLLLPLIFTTAMYWMIGFKAEAEAFFITLATSVLLSQVTVSFGYFISTLAGTLSLAQSISIPICAPALLLSGYFINDASVPVYISWLKYFSWARYANEIMSIVQWHDFGNLTCEYEVHQNQTFFKLQTAVVTATANSTTVPHCYRNGNDVLSTLNYSPSSMDVNFMALLVLLLAFRYLGYVCLLFRARPPQWRKLVKQIFKK